MSGVPLVTAEMVEVVCRIIHPGAESAGIRRGCSAAMHALDEVGPLIRADERERLAAAAASVTITRADDGTLTFTADDPNGVGWVPVSLSLAPTLAANSRAMHDLRAKLKALLERAEVEEEYYAASIYREVFDLIDRPPYGAAPRARPVRAAVRRAGRRRSRLGAGGHP